MALDCECPTGKKAFPSYTAAMSTLNWIKRNGKSKNQGALRRAYRCEVCRFWHATSWSSRSTWWE